MDNIYQNLDASLTAVGIYLHLTKAFDTVHHEITGGAVAQPCVNSHWLSQWEPCIFDPARNRRPLTYRKKLSQVITSTTSTAM